MGTLFRMVCYAPGRAVADRAAKSAFTRIEALERSLSDYLYDSELVRVQLSAFDRARVVSHELYAVLDAAMNLSRRTDGAFDATAGALVAIWREARRQGRLPSEQALQEARQRSGYQKLLLNPRIRSVRITAAGLQLDLGGIAKGFAADRALKVLSESGLKRVLVDAGGDIRAGLPPPGKRGWQVRLDPRLGVRRTFLLSQCAVATSSDTYQYCEIGGVRYSHIVDPRTGLALRHQGAAVVLAPNATTADGWATALCVLDPEEGRRRLNAVAGTEAMILRFGKSKRVYLSEGFPP
jgi:thiamine biosynthesis lipoprotein